MVAWECQRFLTVFQAPLAISRVSAIMDGNTNTPMVHKNSAHPLHTAAIGISFAGVVFFLYGLIVSVPELFHGAMYLHAALLSPFTMEKSPSSAIIGIDPMSGKGLFLLATLLIVVGASIDVWRRLHKDSSNGITGCSSNRIME